MSDQNNLLLHSSFVKANSGKGGRKRVNKPESGENERRKPDPVDVETQEEEERQKSQRSHTSTAHRRQKEEGRRVRPRDTVHLLRRVIAPVPTNFTPASSVVFAVSCLSTRAELDKDPHRGAVQLNFLFHCV
ncbi:unnamed protein product [Pleuronectes platessa]|uniref:Uncharacterized protein n=1 Tax=Pleuronectes platessa TaxID=8262 RepID=A0A9N7YFY8_PLEPL|nr:unnamed protein product [Pleuronectes platessa]